MDPECPQPRRRRRRLVRLGLVVALGLGACVGVLSLSGAAAGAATKGCNAPVYSSDGHSVSLKCTSGRGNHFQIRIRAGNVDGSVTRSSSWVAYGSTARINAGNYFVAKNSLTIYHNNPVCAYTKKGGPTHWCDISANIENWASRAPLYLLQGGQWTSNWYGDRKYRPDCSGLVDMAWHLNSDPDTDALATSTYTKAISRSSLRPGDILDFLRGSHDNHHVVIFAGWNSDHHPGTTDGTFRIWSFGWGYFKDDRIDYHHMLHVSFSDAKIAGHATQYYKARRYIRFS